MAYHIPPAWAHGDYPTAAKLNYYKDGHDAIHTLLGAYQINPAVARRTNNVQGYYFVHKHRWLLYLDDGTIEDPAGIGDTITLSVNGAWTAYDLSSVDWLYPGKLYHVQGVTSCLEDYINL